MSKKVVADSQNLLKKALKILKSFCKKPQHKNKLYNKLKKNNKVKIKMKNNYLKNQIIQCIF